MGIPLLRFLFRKMWNTRWLTLSTMAGLVAAVAFATSIPMYADGALKRVVADSLEAESTGMPAGSLLMRYQASGGETADLGALANVDAFIRDDVPKRIGFPFDTSVALRSIRGTEVVPVDPSKVDASRVRQFTIAAMTGVEEQSEMMQGRWFGETSTDGDALEVVMLEEAMFRSDLHIGDELEIGRAHV